MSDGQNKALKLFYRLLRALYERIWHGDFNAADVTAQLNRYQKMADDIGDGALLGTVYITKTIFNISMGNFDAALDTTQRAIEAYKSSDDPTEQARAAAMTMYRGYVYELMGDYQQALDVYMAVLHEMTTAEDDALNDDLFTLCANLGDVMTTLGQLPQAKHYLDKVLSVHPGTGLLVVDVIIQANISLSDLYLQQHQLEDAIGRARLANEIATRRNEGKRSKFRSLCAIAHVLDQNPYPEEDPDTYYNAAIEAIRLSLNSTLTVAIVVKEARYQKRMGNEARARQFATLASEHLQLLGVSYFDEELAAIKRV